MKMVRSGNLIYMDLEAANRLLYYLDIAYNELDNDVEEAENCLLGRMLQDAIGPEDRVLQAGPKEIRKWSENTNIPGCDSSHYAACRSCTDPMRGMYAHCPLAPLEVVQDGQT